MSINDEKCMVLPSFLASEITFFVFDFRQLPCQYFLKFFPFFVHCCFCFWYYHCLMHSNKFAHKIAMFNEFIPFPAM